MLTIHEEVEVGAGISEAFAYVADFRNLPQWDPSCRRAALITEEPVGAGASFSLDVAFRGRVTPYEYEITKYERPSLVVLQGRGGRVRALDEIEFRTTEDGTRITYRASFALPLWLLPAQLLLRGAIRELGRGAAAGLVEQLGAPQCDPA